MAKEIKGPFPLADYKPLRVQRVATATFWRTIHHDGKISPGWCRGGGASPVLERSHEPQFQIPERAIPPPPQNTQATHKKYIYFLLYRKDETFPPFHTVRLRE